METRKIPGLLASLCLLAWASSVGAAMSPILLDRQPDAPLTFSYRFQHPHFSGSTSANFLTGFHEFAFAAQVSRASALSLALPFVKAGLADYPESESGLTLGNVELALHAGGELAGRNQSVAVGLILPTAADDLNYTEMALGIFSHPFAIQTFVPDVLAVFARYGQRIPATAESFVRLEVGPELYLPTGDSNDSASLWLRYGLGVGVEAGVIGASVEFAGYWQTDSDGEGFNEASAHVLAAGVQYAGSTLRPALYYELSTDDIFDDLLDGVIGVRLTLVTR